MLIILLFKAALCCVPLRPPNPGGPSIASPTPGPELTTSTTTEQQPTNGTEEKASTRFTVVHKKSFYECTYDFTYSLEQGIKILDVASSRCEKSVEDQGALEFLETHNFQVVSNDGIELSCSSAAAYHSTDNTIELVDAIILESIKCVVTPGACLTEDGPQFYSQCKVPYILNGRMFQDCTDWPQKEGGVKETRLWCATQTNDEKVMKEGQWGWCSSSCGYCGGKDVSAPSEITSEIPPEIPSSLTCKTEKGHSCIFPFKDDGDQTYNECADWKSKYHWCATEVNPDLTYKTWEKCVLSTCTTEVPTSDCKTVSGPNSGDLCVFPFKDGATTHNTCTVYKGKQWCATSLKTDGSYEGYGYCDEETCPLEKTRINRLNNTRVNPFKNTRVNPLKNTRVNLLNNTRVDHLDTPRDETENKCNLDCLLRTNTEMVSSSKEKLVSPAPVDDLKGTSYYASDTLLKFKKGQNAIDLKCTTGRFSTFDGEKVISVACNGKGIFKVTGQFSGRVWENVENTELGCNPCPGYKSLVGTMKDNPDNILSTHYHQTTPTSCLSLCEDDNECEVIQFSSKDQRCTLYKKLEILEKENNGDIFVCQALGCGCDCKNSRAGGMRFVQFKRQTTKKTQTNTIVNIFDRLNRIPVYSRLEVQYLPAYVHTWSRDNYRFIKAADGYDDYGTTDEFGATVTTTCVPIHNDYTNTGMDRGHLVAKETIEQIFSETISTTKLYDLGRQMANVIPQHPCFNQALQGEWRKLEEAVRNYLRSQDKNMENKDYKVIVNYGVIPGQTILTNDKGDDVGIHIPDAILIGLELWAKGKGQVIWTTSITNPNKAEEPKTQEYNINFQDQIKILWKAYHGSYGADEAELLIRMNNY